MILSRDEAWGCAEAYLRIGLACECNARHVDAALCEDGRTVSLMCMARECYACASFQLDGDMDEETFLERWNN